MPDTTRMTQTATVAMLSQVISDQQDHQVEETRRHRKETANLRAKLSHCRRKLKEERAKQPIGAPSSQTEMIEVLELSELLAEFIEKDEIIMSQEEKITELAARVEELLGGGPVQEGRVFNLRDGHRKTAALKDDVRNVLVDLLAKDGLSGNKTFAAMNWVLTGLTGEEPEGKVSGQTAVMRQLIAERSEILECDLAVRLASSCGWAVQKLTDPPPGV